MQYIQFFFEDISVEQKELLIAMLSNIGFEGFEEEDESLKAFILSSVFDEKLFNEVINILPVKYFKSFIKQINWNEEWEADFQPVEILHPVDKAPFAYLRASFHAANPAFLYDLLITPKMSFGTGHHATTYLMVSQMSQIDFKGKTVIDFGTGTGVLAILAEKMGAEFVAAIDCDDWSINNAKENFEENSCSKIVLIKAEMIPVQYKAAIILANINLNIILANIVSVKRAAFPGATILFSGIMLHDEQQILAELTGSGFAIKEVFRKDNWIAVLCRFSGR